MAYERCTSIIYVILIIYLPLFVNCQNITNPTINGYTLELRRNTTSYTYSTSELSTKLNSTVDLDTAPSNHSLEFLGNSTEKEVVLSCTCVPYYQCDADKSIDPQSQNYEETSKVRVEMENCSNMSVLDVCCLKQSLMEISFGKKSKSLENIPSSTVTVNNVSKMESSTELTSMTDLETTTSLDDFLVAMINSTRKEVVLSCTCAPFYRCDPTNIIVPQLQSDEMTLEDRPQFPINYEETPKVRLEMEDCRSNMSEVCCLKNTIPALDYIDFMQAADRCGVRNVGGIGNQSTRLVEYSDYGEFPWVVAILSKTDNNYRYRCAGTLIDRNVILTSAHCIEGQLKLKASDIKVRAGEWNTRNSDEFFSHQDRFLEKVIIHKEYNPKNLHNDIAILILKEPFMYHIHIGRICLTQSNSSNQFPVNATCFSSGWGKDRFDSVSMYKVFPKKSSLELVEHDSCQELLRESRLGQHFNLDESFICAFDKQSCLKDGGGPLMCSFDSKPGVYQLVGMVAWGLGCGDRYPSVFVNVAKFRTWISDELKIAGYKSNLL